MNFDVLVEKDLEDVIPLFVKNRNNDINNLKLALESNDWKAIQTIGHSLSGVGGGFGFHEITNKGKEIEEVAKLLDKVRIEQLIEELENFMNHFNIIFIDEK